MKILVKFGAQIGLAEIEKEISPNEPVQNLEILISLSYQKMNECKLYYNGKALNNKNQPLRQIFLAGDSNVVTVDRKSELQAYAEQAGSFIQLFQRYPTYFAGGVVVLIFIILFIMGG